MPKTKIAINGFGRIGRNAFKIALEKSDLEIVAINDLTDTKTLAHLLKYDTNYGAYDHDVDSTDGALIVDDKEIKVFNERDPAQLPWDSLDVDVVIESTGIFRNPDDARAHVKAGAKRVVISAPAKGDSADTSQTVVLGVNDDDTAADNDVFTNASCTTNCISPVANVMEGEFGIEKAMMTTIHSYTSSQNLMDGPHKDLRRGRAAAENIVPTTTGATKAAAKVLPMLEGRFDGMAIRVPTSVVSLSDFTILTKKDVTVEEVNNAFKKAADNPFYQGILSVTDEPLVSSDLKGDSHSAIIDLLSTAVTGGNMVKIIAWYDNEWGYSNRLVEAVTEVGKSI